MNKKAKIELYIAMLLVGLIVSFSVYFVLAKSIDPNDTRAIGYEFIGDDTVHVWNTQDDYYFNKSSGIQFSNHYDNYWTKNVFCLGYYNSGEWIKISCIDELNNFNKQIDTDNSTYVNATLWKDITYSGYDMRLGINYYLGLNDQNLSITIYGKNIDSVTYPFDVGFAWKIKDIEIPTNNNSDMLLINNTLYNLSEPIDLIFQDMAVIKYFNSTISYAAKSFFQINDEREYLRLDWDNNTNYAVKLYSDGTQSNAYVMLAINAGIFASGQSKTTVFNWIDAVGDYLSVSWDTSAHAGVEEDRGAEMNSTYIWITQANADLIIKYKASDGTYISNFSTAAEISTPYDIGVDSNWLWIMDYAGDKIIRYYHNGSYSGYQFGLRTVPNDHGWGLATNGTTIWVGDPADDEVYLYYTNGTQYKSWDTGGSGNTKTTSVAYDYAGSIWTSDEDLSRFYRFNSSTGAFIASYPLTSGHAYMFGIAANSSWVQVVSYNNKEVYMYEGTNEPPDVPPVSEDCSPTAGVTWTITDVQICDGVQESTGSGSINIGASGKLYLINGANVTTAKIYLLTTGDQIFIDKNSKLAIG